MKRNVLYFHLEYERLCKNLSIQELADASGISYVSMRRKLRGEAPWQLEECMAVKKALNSDLPIETLFEKRE